MIGASSSSSFFFVLDLFDPSRLVWIGLRRSIEEQKSQVNSASEQPGSISYTTVVHYKLKDILSMYSNTSKTRGSKLAKFSNSQFLSLFFTSKLAVPLLSTQIRDFCYFLSPKIREFGGITVFLYASNVKYLTYLGLFNQFSPWMPQIWSSLST